MPLQSCCCGSSAMPSSGIISTEAARCLKIEVWCCSADCFKPETKHGVISLASLTIKQLTLLPAETKMVWCHLAEEE